MFAAAKQELLEIDKYGWESPNVSRQRMEYAIVCAMITGGFFHKYYVAGSMRIRESDEADQVGYIFSSSFSVT